MRSQVQLQLFGTAILIFCWAFAASQECFDKNVTDASSTISGKDLTEGSTEFGIALFKNVLARSKGPKENVFISPISVWSALTVTYVGTRGQTEKEMATALNYGPHNQATVAKSIENLNDLTHTATESANYTFKLANRLYFEKTLPIRECMNTLLKNDIEKVDFVNSPQPSRVQINDWVADQTNNKIRDLIPEDYVSPATTMIIVNAAYFNGIWSKQFSKEATKNDEDFFVTPDAPIKVKMMNKESMYRFRRDPESGCSSIELPYSGDDISMIIVLPDANSNIDELAANKLNKAGLDQIYEGMTPTNVKISLPKFKIEQTFELNEDVKKLGINALFNPSADLSGFTDQKGSFVDHIRHKTYIDVNEGGTEAAAATSISTTRLMAIPAREFEEFIVNRPFLLIIRNNKSKTILFIGYIKDPKE